MKTLPMPYTINPYNTHASNYDFCHAENRFLRYLGYYRYRLTLNEVEERDRDIHNTTHIYRIFQSDGNDRSEISRVKSKDIDKVVEFIKSYYIKEEYQDDFEEDGDPEYSIYLISNRCSCQDDCDTLREDPESACESCEGSYLSFEIERDDETEREYKTIYGTDEFFDLDKKPSFDKCGIPNDWGKNKDWNPSLAANLRAAQAGGNFNEVLSEELTRQYARKVGSR